MDCRDVMVMMTVMLPGPVGGGDELCFTRGWAFVILEKVEGSWVFYGRW
jgi:hypothetical protein